MSGVLAAVVGTAGIVALTADWADIGTSGSPASSPAANSNVTITGITRPITLRLAWSGTMTFEYSKNGGSYTSITSNTTDIVVVAGDTLRFRATIGVGGTTETATVKNASLGGATVDTFNVYLT